MTVLQPVQPEPAVEDGPAIPESAEAAEDLIADGAGRSGQSGAVWNGHGLALHHATKGTARIPALTGLDLLGALRALRTAGFHATTTLWETKVGPWGDVLVQQPAAGSRARLGSRVEVIVAIRPRVAVPLVAGLDLDVAIERLTRAGLVIGGVVERESRRVPNGRVVQTRPAQGYLLVDQSPVTVVVSVDPPAAARDRDHTNGMERR